VFYSFGLLPSKLLIPSSPSSFHFVTSLSKNVRASVEQSHDRIEQINRTAHIRHQCRKTMAKRHLANTHLDTFCQWTFGSRHLAYAHLVKRHLVDRHFADTIVSRHSAHCHMVKYPLIDMPIFIPWVSTKCLSNKCLSTKCLSAKRPVAESKP
jgi:hypothetical protein